MIIKCDICEKEMKKEQKVLLDFRSVEGVTYAKKYNSICSSCAKLVLKSIAEMENKITAFTKALKELKNEKI